MGNIIFVKPLDKHPDVQDASVYITKDTKYDGVDKKSHIPVFAHSPSMSGTMFIGIEKLIESGHIVYTD